MAKYEDALDRLILINIVCDSVLSLCFIGWIAVTIRLKLYSNLNSLVRLSLLMALHCALAIASLSEDLSFVKQEASEWDGKHFLSSSNCFFALELISIAIYSCVFFVFSMKYWMLSMTLQKIQ